MLLFLLEYAAICAGTWLLWKGLKGYVVNSPLDNIPGPPSDSWWAGKKPMALQRGAPDRGFPGNLRTMFNRHRGWKFHEDMDKFGAVVKIYGLFMVTQATPLIDFALTS